MTGPGDATAASEIAAGHANQCASRATRTAGWESTACPPTGPRRPASRRSKPTWPIWTRSGSTPSSTCNGARPGQSRRQVRPRCPTITPRRSGGRLLRPLLAERRGAGQRRGFRDHRAL